MANFAVEKAFELVEIQFSSVSTEIPFSLAYSKSSVGNNASLTSGFNSYLLGA